MRALLTLAAAALTLSSPIASAANTLPLSGAWNIAPAGTAASSGELLFRITPGDGSGATEVAVFVFSGTNDTGVASNIRRALSTQLRSDRFDIQAGEGSNILLTNSGKAPDFSLELVNSDVENVRVTVQSTTPVAPPTVPKQATPANPPTPATPATPASSGDALPPPTSSARSASQPEPPSSGSAPVESGSGVSANPPPPASTPPPN